MLVLVSYVLITRYYFTNDGPIIEIKPEERVKKLKIKQETDTQPHYSIYNHCSNSQLRFRLAQEPENFVVSTAKNSTNPFAALEISGPDFVPSDESLDITYNPSSKLQKPVTPKSLYYVQLAVTKTKTLAEEKWYNLSKAYKFLIGRKYVIAQYNAGDKGLFFMLRINSLSFEEAKVLCRKINNFGHAYCLIDRES